MAPLVEIEIDPLVLPRGADEEERRALPGTVLAGGRDMHLGADSTMFTVETPSIEQPSAASSTLYEMTRRVFDTSVALAVMFVLSPLMLVLCVSILVTQRSWPIFTHDRIGRGGEPFKMFKLKTMRGDRRNRQSDIDFACRRRSHKTRIDPRVTRFGRFLRRTALDELPQLWNVVRGDMSLVGPRPELPNIVARYETWQHRRHEVRPGLTGWWQVMGPPDAPMHEHVEYDLHYVENRSWALDLRIMWMTFGVLVRGRGRY